ncbi:MAG: rhomboid family intramembrane serine protease [Saprospiraceae bacterium]|nr:rhomboid family intramembrane serine protease [Saprospiraceae bacterium]
MFGNISPVVKNLIILNVGIFLLQNLLGDIAYLGMLSHPESVNFRPFQFFTYMFLHSGFMHLFFNMLWLYFMGSKLEYFMGSKNFITLYIAAGIGAAILHWAVNDYIFHNPHWVLLGASGAVAGIMMGAALYFPNDEVIIFPIPIPIKILYLVIFYTVYELYKGLNVQDGVAHFAHLGGLLFGYLYLKLFNKDGGYRY